jgi:hypothetical protein
MGPYTASGVDLTLVRWMLSLTPAERLDVLQNLVEFLAEVRVETATDPLSVNPANAV